jgi:C-terminal processing protease CtpA/Prc
METALRSDLTAPAALASRQAQPAVPARSRASVVRGAGYVRVARLRGDVGYIELLDFPDTPRFRAVTQAVLDGLRDVRALIIDLRANRGGSRVAASILRSRLFDTEEMLGEEGYCGPEQRGRMLRLVPGGSDARFTDGPVLILTSAATSELAAEFAYVLKALGRATVVGEAPAAAGIPLRPSVAAPAWSALPVARGMVGKVR